MTARTTLILALLAVLAVAGCGGDGDKNSKAGKVVKASLTDAGCEPAEVTVAAGPTTFEVTNKDADAVSEFEVLDGDRIVGEVENLAPGLSGKFSVTLKPGRYTTYCPGGTSVERGALTATGVGTTQTSGQAAAAVARYRAYIEGQTELLVRETAAFVSALRAGNVELAKQRYAAARIPYERIEPVAESFGNLDPAIDARAGDVPAAQWTGFHPIERTLWVKGTTAGTARLATKLIADVKTLQSKVRTIQLEPAQIANGAVELLGEVSKSKITGEEERYSHIDLVDFEANVDGARSAFTAVRPIVLARQPKLTSEIDERFAAVSASLRPYRRGAAFVSYTGLDARDTRTLSRAIDALAEPLSQVGAIVVAQ